MSTTPVVLRNASDTFAHEGKPNRNFSLNRKLFLSAAVANQRYAYLFFSRPFPKGATIISAKLKVYNTDLWSGSVIMTAKLISSKWSKNRLTWNNRPGVDTGAWTVTQSDKAANSLWEIDVTSALQEISLGQAWYGFRLSVDGSTLKAIWSAEAQTKLRPTLEVSWSDAPEAPEVLVPDDEGVFSVQRPTFQCDFTDHAGDTEMSAMQVQVATVSGGYSPPFWDSGEFPTTVPQLITDPTNPAYVAPPGGAFVGFSDNTTGYWRCRVKDGAGLWSEWSEEAAVTRQTKGVLTITSPAASPNNYVEEATPPISWTFTGRVQQAYQVLIWDNVTNELIWTTGKVTSTATTVTVPDDAYLELSGLYRVEVRVWDTIAGRVAIPDDKIYQVATRDFFFQFDPTVDEVSNLVGSTNHPYPWATLTWTRATQPDEWETYRDGKLIAKEIGNDLFLAGTTYQFIDRMAPRYEEHTYEVVAVVNGAGSSDNPTVDITPVSVGPFLCKPDGTDGVFILNPNISASQGAIEEVIEFIGDAPPLLVSQGQRGYEGQIAGILSGDADQNVTAREARDRFKRMIRDKGQTLHLTFSNEAIKCFIFDTSYRPVKDNEGVYYVVNFSFVQVNYR